MKICFIGKYAPIQGGVSRENFWSAYALAQAGFEVHVVTNAQEVEYQYRTLEDAWFGHPQAHLKATARGKLTIHTSSSSLKHSYIPWANPFVTKLATMATEVITAYGCDLICGYYLEPYGVAAYLASRWTGVPYGLRHAGSDVGRLLLCPDLQTTYIQTILAADYIFTARSTLRRFLHLGIDLDKLYFPARSSLPTTYFHPDAPPLDINALVALVCRSVPETRYRGIYHRFADKPFDPSLPTIGIYGKLGLAKGSFDLLKALKQLHETGFKFNFLALTQGRLQTMFDFAQCIEEYGLTPATWLLPFIPHWSIPNFIRACTAVCFLERDFPIKIHQPGVPGEVFACGTCLILSQEIAEKQFYREKLRSGYNAYIVDARNISYLAATLKTALENPPASREIGMHGYYDISAGTEDFPAFVDNLASSFTIIQQDVVLRRNSMSIAEMQACLARLYVDDSFRMLFDLAPEASLDAYKLTDEEIAALKGIDKKMLQRFAASLKAKRRERLKYVYPLLFHLPGIDINRYFTRFYHLYPAKPHDSTLSRIQEFGSFMEQCLTTDEDTPPYASEIARYERLCHAAAFLPTPEDAFTHINATPATATTPLTLEDRPIIRPGCYAEMFAYDIVKIAHALREQQESGNLQTGQYYFVFQQVEIATHPKIFAVSSATYDLFMLCDGSHTIATLIHKMEKRFGREDLEKELLQMLQHLSSLRMIGVAKHE
ncbi:glycosyltransferase [Ktedonosporobacter rubrisoli]|uniref:glycosyltransferase n=1 Tax=Ktedonosporobacter rubrisoli TaxID=2509675 RepID=UPI0013EE99E3|nr:glycosyltransferase [Ktedonosporobacter rubrisoli]